ncbi:MAG: hypothetical protein L7W42_05660 [Alphaproteobacteria bacterium]|nr:hypothetical protein [Alphaproteobacteria bacterium]
MKNEIAEQFQMLNGHIASAISQKDYMRAATLDRARQDILKDLCLMDMQSIDAEFFALIEECARDNASLIQTVQEDMSHISWQTSRSMKAQRAYLS